VVPSSQAYVLKRFSIEFVLKISLNRSLPSGLVNMPLFLNAKRPSPGPMAEADVVTASSRGKSAKQCAPASCLYATFSSIVRAFLVEEAKIVKKVIKSQAKGSKK
jgi:hypothetical protein